MAKEPWYKAERQALLEKTAECRQVTEALYIQAGKLKAGLGSQIKLVPEGDRGPLENEQNAVAAAEEKLERALDLLKDLPVPDPTNKRGGTSRPGVAATVVGAFIVLLGVGIWSLLKDVSDQPSIEGYDAKTVLAIAAFGVAASAYLATAARDVRKALGDEDDVGRRRTHVKNLFTIDVVDTIAICLIVGAMGRLLGPYLGDWVVIRDAGDADLLLTIVAMLTVASGITLHALQRFQAHPRI